jgi:hypothetical protein
LSFIPDNSPPISPINERLEAEISDHRRELFRSFENHVIVPFCDKLTSLDPEGVVRVAGSYINPTARVRLSSDVDLVVLSPGLKTPERYITALLTVASLAADWRQEMKSSHNSHVEPYFFTRAITEEDKFMLTRIVTGCEEKNILPCHFLYYRDEAEIVQREEDLGRRILTASRAVLGGKPNTEAVFKSTSVGKLSSLGAIQWNIERAIAELVLNHSLTTPGLIVRGYANQIYHAVRNLADSLPLPENEKTTTGILRLLDLDRGDGLLSSFRPIESLRSGAPVGEKAPLVDLLTPAVMLLKSLTWYADKQD